MSLPFDEASAAPIRRQAGSDTVCLLLHGLTGAPARDLWFLADYLTGHSISVVAPLLTGHGKTWKELELATAESWQNDAIAGLDEARTMGKTVFVAGLSMGGTLTLYLGEHRPEIAGLVTIKMTVKNQRQEIVQVYEDKLLAAKRPAGAAPTESGATGCC